MTERADQGHRDDDNLSITSTVASDNSEDHEFKVDRILAEKQIGTKKFYLISWDGYPQERSTWEPHKNVAPDTIDDWKERHRSEMNGFVDPFDLDEFQALLEKVADEKAERHRLRKIKRKQSGIPVSPSESEREANDSDSSIEALEENELDDMRSSGKRKSRSPSKKDPKAIKLSSGQRQSSTSFPKRAPSKSSENNALDEHKLGLQNARLFSRQALKVCHITLLLLLCSNPRLL